MASFFTALRNHRAFQALQYRDFRLVSGSQTFANIGTWMDELSRGWLIYQLTDSVAQLGLVRGVQLIPLMLLAPFAGSAADRYPRKTLLIAAQTVHTLSFAIVALLIFTGGIAPWHVYVTGIIAGMMQVIQQPSRTSLVSDTVPEKYLTNAIGFTSMIFNGARLVGPALAGVIIAVADTGGAFAVQACCMLIALGWTMQLSAVPHRGEGAEKARRESFVHSIAEGWKFAWRNETVRAGILCTTIVSVLMFPFTTLLPVFARDILGVGASGQGLLLAAMGVGAIISAVTITVAGHRLPRGKVIVGSSLAYGLMLIVFAVSPWFVLSLLVMVLAGLFHVHGNALVHTVVQSHSPAEFRGRTMALFNMSQMLNTAGSMLIGLLAVALGTQGAVAAMGTAGALAVALLIVLQPRALQIR